jgi:hypothetical protein
MDGWTLSRDSHYQLTNRFAWAWKLASMGVPVVLGYLGFQGAAEMKDRENRSLITPTGHALTWNIPRILCLSEHGAGTSK